MRVRPIQTLRWMMLALLAALSAPLAAHSTPNSEVRLRVADDRVIADIIVPRGEYAYGTGHPVDGSARSLAIARTYLRDNIAATTRAGEAWTLAIPTVEFVQRNGPPDLHAVAELVPPDGASLEDLVISWRVLVDRLPGHFALFLADGELAGEERTVLGAVREGSGPLTVALARPSPLQPLVSAARLGAHHILEGYDHLLFLLVLLLPAPLLAASGRWAGQRPAGATLFQLAKIVTAFTIGHSVTLVVATLWRWSLPVAPVEIAIALSVLVAAIHAARPILPGREPLIALVFGLVHGLAFATLVQGAHAGVATSALALLGFNLGIELVQLAIVAAVVPALLVLSRYAVYTGVRLVLAAVCAAAALAWIVNRATGLADGLVAAMEAAMAQMIWLVPLSALAALALALRSLLAGRRYDGTEQAAPG